VGSGSCSVRFPVILSRQTESGEAPCGKWLLILDGGCQVATKISAGLSKSLQTWFTSHTIDHSQHRKLGIEVSHRPRKHLHIHGPVYLGSNVLSKDIRQTTRRHRNISVRAKRDLVSRARSELIYTFLAVAAII